MYQVGFVQDETLTRFSPETALVRPVHWDGQEMVLDNMSGGQLRIPEYNSLRAGQIVAATFFGSGAPQPYSCQFAEAAVPITYEVPAYRPAGITCMFPGDLDRAGRRCGERAASVRSGGH
jgi:hypothetical protein